MKPLQRLLDYRDKRLTLLGAIIIEMVREKPMYLVEIREMLDMDPGSANKLINRMEREGWVVKEFEPAPSDNRGAPKSALVRLAGCEQ